MLCPHVDEAYSIFFHGKDATKKIKHKFESNTNCKIEKDENVWRKSFALGKNKYINKQINKLKKKKTFLCVLKIVKLSPFSQRRPEGSLFNIYYTEV